MSSSSTDVSLPTGSNASETDAFWLMSVYEANTYFAENDARKWMNGDYGEFYWLRSPVSDNSDLAYRVHDYGGIYSNKFLHDGYGARVAFMLELA